MKREVITVGEPLRYPISQAIKVGDLVFAAGRTGRDQSTGQIPDGGVGVETRIALQKLAAVFEAAGTTLQRAVKTTVYLVDMDDFEAMNAAYREFFADEPPARVTVQVAGLHGGVHVEIEAVAVMP